MTSTNRSLPESPRDSELSPTGGKNYARPHTFRWKAGLIIFTMGVVAQTFFVFRFAENPTFRKMSVLWVWPPTLFALVIWWIFRSGLSRQTRFVPLAVMASLALVAIALFRVEGSDGDMMPRIVYRWTPTAEQKARDYWSRQPATVTATDRLIAPSAVDSGDVAEPAPTVVPLTVDPDDWPDFRGPKRDGIVRGTGFRVDWETRPPVELWRHPVGPGWSSFAILGNLALTMEQRDDQESTVAYRLDTGEQVWIHGDRARFTAIEVNGGDGPHSTPVIAGDETYTLGATGILNCLETRTGKPRWTRQILNDAGTPEQPAKNIEWGISGSPLLYENLVIVVAGGTQDRSVIAYQKDSGEIIWTAGSFPASYAGARVEELRGIPQLLVFHGTGISSFAPDSGQFLWNYPFQNMAKVNSAQPLKVSDTSLVIGAGYGQGGVGLNLHQQGSDWSAEAIWKTPRFKLKFNDALLIDGFLYGLDDGILTCVDATTGKTRWKGKRFGYGQLLAFEQTLLILSEEGDLVLAPANPERFQESARLHVLDGTTWNHPAIAHGKLLVRNGTMAACFDVAP